MALHPEHMAEHEPIPRPAPQPPADMFPGGETPYPMPEPQVAAPEQFSSFVNQGPQDTPPVSQYPPGPQLFDPTIIASGGGHSPADGLVAHAGGGQAAATPIRAGVSRIATCATAADSVYLPRAAGGQVIFVMNAGAAACQVFATPGSTDTINGVAGSTGVSLAAGKCTTFCSSSVGTWFWNLSA